MCYRLQGLVEHSSSSVHLNNDPYSEKEPFLASSLCHNSHKGPSQRLVSHCDVSLSIKVVIYTKLDHHTTELLLWQLVSTNIHTSGSYFNHRILSSY